MRGEVKMYCRQCGKEISEGSAFCPFCGTATSDHAEQTRQHPGVVNIVNNNKNENINGMAGYISKSKWTAFFLCLCLGFLGAHRFYVGKNGTGILWLLTAGFFGIGWVIDLLLILFGAFRDAAGFPLR